MHRLNNRKSDLVCGYVCDDVGVKRVQLAALWVADALAAPAEVPRRVRHPHRRELVPLWAVDGVAASPESGTLCCGRVVPGST